MIIYYFTTHIVLEIERADIAYNLALDCRVNIYIVVRW